MECDAWVIHGYTILGEVLENLAVYEVNETMIVVRRQGNFMMVDEGTLRINLVCYSLITTDVAQSVEISCLHSPAHNCQSLPTPGLYNHQ